MASIYELLKKDHRKVKQIMKKISQTEEGDEQEREELFAQLKTELTAHSKAENSAFYTFLREQEDTEAIAREAEEEHHVVELLLEELDELPKGDKQWIAKMTVLQENVEHHVEEEEGEMFKEAREVLGKEDEKRIAKEFQEGKQMWLSRSREAGVGEEEEAEEAPRSSKRRAA